MNRPLARLSVYINLVLLTTLIVIVSQAGLLDQWMAAIDSDRLSSQVAVATVQPKPDSLIYQSGWQDEIQYQTAVNQGKRYAYCLFGDSITSGLGNTFGQSSFNFALSGMSSVSLVEQLKRLAAAQLNCDQVIIAIGTNDADYRITNAQFLQNMQRSINFSRQLHASRILLLPAFYSTVAASHDLSLAGPLARVEEINQLLQEVTRDEKVESLNGGIEALYNGKALRKDLTTDGVHLNARGRMIYRQALLQQIQ